MRARRRCRGHERLPQVSETAHRLGVHHVDDPPSHPAVRTAAEPSHPGPLSPPDSVNSGIERQTFVHRRGLKAADATIRSRCTPAADLALQGGVQHALGQLLQPALPGQPLCGSGGLRVTEACCGCRVRRNRFKRPGHRAACPYWSLACLGLVRDTSGCGAVLANPLAYAVDAMRRTLSDVGTGSGNRLRCWGRQPPISVEIAFVGALALLAAEQGVPLGTI